MPKPKPRGRFKRFFKGLYEKVCARDQLEEEDNYDPSRKRVLSAPRRASVRLDEVEALSQRQQDDARIREMRKQEQENLLSNRH